MEITGNLLWFKKISLWPQHSDVQSQTWFICRNPQQKQERNVKGRSKVTARMSLACLEHIFTLMCVSVYVWAHTRTLFMYWRHGVLLEQSHLSAQQCGLDLVCLLCERLPSEWVFFISVTEKNNFSSLELMSVSYSIQKWHLVLVCVCVFWESCMYMCESVCVSFSIFTIFMLLCVHSCSACLLLSVLESTFVFVLGHNYALIIWVWPKSDTVHYILWDSSSTFLCHVFIWNQIKSQDR